MHTAHFFLSRTVYSTGSSTEHQSVHLRARRNVMRKFAFMLTILFVAALYDTAAVLAQTSGSFSASYGATQCAISANDGNLSPGINGNALPPVIVKVSSGSGVALVITPSFVTGLY